MSRILFSCYLVTAVVRLIYIDMSTLTLKDINISQRCGNKNFVNESVAPFTLSILLYQLLPFRLYILVFQKCRLQGPAWTALNEGDGVPISQEFLIFGISDQNKFFIIKSLSLWFRSYDDISPLRLGFTYLGMSQFDIS